MLNKLISGLVLVLFPITLFAAGDIEAGRQKAAMCVVCHGADGNSSNPSWPNLAGQHAEYIVKQLHDYRTGAGKTTRWRPWPWP